MLNKSPHPIAFILTFFLLFVTSGFSQGDLMVLPKRLVFDGSQRSQEINLINTGSKPATYAISIIQYKMTESGKFEQVTEPEEGQRFASDFLRYYPRKVVLGPNEAQSVRVQLTKTGDLKEGEYRSHIYFRAIEEQAALGEEDLNKTEGISINIKTVFGISIPVIIREGNSTTSINIDGLVMDSDPENPTLSMVIHRVGNMSIYGELNAIHISPAGMETNIGKVKGLAVYTPNDKRLFSMQLNSISEVDLKEGEIRLEFKDANGKKLGEALLDL